MTTILDGRDIYGMGLESWLRSLPMERLARRRRLTPPALTEVAAAEPLDARVNHGRWIVECPGACPGAEAAWKEIPLFWCWTCGNKAVGGAWIRVVFPADVEAIEAALDARPHAGVQHWYPDETADDLHAENVANGVTT